MRGKLVRFSYFARWRLNRFSVTRSETPPKPFWLLRLWNKTAAPFWMARLRRQLRHNYRDSVALQMHLVSNAIYRIEARGLENFTYRPSTIIACGHKRDMDVPIIIPLLYIFKKPSRRPDLKLMYLAARDDVFERGFLTLYFPWLDFLRPLIARSRLNRFFKMLQACPVKLPDEQTVNQLLHETWRLEGNLPLDEALGNEWQERLLGQVARPGQTIKDLIYQAPLKALGQYATPRMFKEPLAGRIRQRHYATTVQQLHFITRILERGGTLIVLPEGRVTPDGRFCKMRAAVIRLVLQTRVETRLLPINLTYDFMDTAKPNVTVLCGPEIDNLKHHSKNELAEIIRRKVAGLTCVTFSGLVSQSLIEAARVGTTRLDHRQLSDQVWNEGQALRARGLPLDRQLDDRPTFQARFERFIEYAYKQGGIFRPDLDHQTLQLDLEGLNRQECSKHTDNPVRYCYNELSELLETRQLPVAAPIEPAANVVSEFALASKRQARLTAG